jgi:hypothetical protein
VLAQDDSDYHPMLPDPDPGEVDFGDVLYTWMKPAGQNGNSGFDPFQRAQQRR